MWEVRCEKAVVVGFILGEQGSEREYLVDPSDINWAVGGSVDGWCMGGIQANDGVSCVLITYTRGGFICALF